MFSLFIFSLSSVAAIYSIQSIQRTKKDSFKNKILFIYEFKNSELYTHPYTTNNYMNIKRLIKSEYPLIDYLEKQDGYYTQNLFREDKTSLKYNYSLAGKHDLDILNQEIEFDTLRECFTQICKNDNECKNNNFLSRNKKLVTLFCQNIVFTKKISKYFVIMQVSSVVSILFLIKTLILFL